MRVSRSHTADLKEARVEHHWRRITLPSIENNSVFIVPRNAILPTPVSFFSKGIALPVLITHESYTLKGLHGHLKLKGSMHILCGHSYKISGLFNGKTPQDP